MADQNQGTRGISFGRVLGARVVVQPSTLIMLVLLAFLLSSSEDGITRRGFTIGLILAAALIVSVFLHEVAHAIAARAFKRDVHEIVLTLWGGHTSFDSRNLTPLVNGVVSLAGPAANVVIAGVVAAALQATTPGGLLGAALWWVVWANLLLAAFNALPGIPMDGGRVLEAIVWGATKNRNRGTIVAAWAGRVVAIGVVVFAIGVPFLRGSTPSIFSMLWAVLIFGLLWPAASNALKVATTMTRVESIGARSLMVTAVPIPFAATVHEAAQLAARAGALEVVVLAADRAPAGHFPVSLIDAVPESERAHTHLQSVTMPMPRGAEMSPDLHGREFVNFLQQWWGKTEVWAVVEHGHVIGVVRAQDVQGALQ
ncbi:site-2 protease family protein [Demequina aurantiaca]|uniref:site-2 protease family protein n=1 Tax=Demequina aurantiaca TaxID=676200 RepID=UPI000781BBAF|nr:site-2 protease family protein [Demequina aurantiaca]